jgi:hypothetical protein
VLAQGCSHVHYLWFIRRDRKAEAMFEALARQCHTDPARRAGHDGELPGSSGHDGSP